MLTMVVPRVFVAGIAAVAAGLLLAAAASADAGEKGNGLDPGGVPNVLRGKTPGALFTPYAKEPGLSLPGALDDPGLPYETNIPGNLIRNRVHSAQGSGGPET